MRTRRQITQSCGTAFAETPDPLGGRLSAQLELGRGLAQAEFPLQHSFCHLLSTVNSQSSMMMVVHSVSWFAFASQHQLPSSRPDGQQPIETSQLKPRPPGRTGLGGGGKAVESERGVALFQDAKAGERPRVNGKVKLFVVLRDDDAAGRKERSRSKSQQHELVLFRSEERRVG